MGKMKEPGRSKKKIRDREDIEKNNWITCWLRREPKTVERKEIQEEKSKEHAQRQTTARHSNLKKSR